MKVFTILGLALAISFKLTSAQGAPAKAGQSFNPDIRIVLAVDVSGSVMSHKGHDEYAIQLEGIAAALASEMVRNIFEQCQPLRVSLAYMEWSNTYDQHYMKDEKGNLWFDIRNSTDLPDFASRILNSERTSKGRTDIAGAIYSATTEILKAEKKDKSAPLATHILLSADGYQNEAGDFEGQQAWHVHKRLRFARERATNADIKISTVVLTKTQGTDSGRNGLVKYFDEYVNSSPLKARRADSYQEYAEQLIRVLMAQLSTCIS